MTPTPKAEFNGSLAALRDAFDLKDFHIQKLEDEIDELKEKLANYEAMDESLKQSG